MSSMASSVNPIVTGIFLLLTLWLSTVTYFLYRTVSHYNKLTKGSDRQTLQTILTDLLKDVQTEKLGSHELKERVKKLEHKADYTFQKITLMRFNPFADTGGEQSFIIGLLDNKNNGILITSLQGRSGTRWYAKEIKEGKGQKFDLSNEEKEAIKHAHPLS